MEKKSNKFNIHQKLEIVIDEMVEKELSLKEGQYWMVEELRKRKK